MFSDLDIRLSHLRAQRNRTENRELELDIERLESAIKVGKEIETPLGNFPGRREERKDAAK